MHPDLLTSSVKVGLNLVTDEVNHPIGIVDPDDGSERLFVIQQTGEILSLSSDYVLNTNALMDISTNLVSLALDTVGYDERGLLGFVFHPDYLNNNTFYMYVSMPTNSSPDFYFPIGYDGGENVVIDHHSVVVECTYIDENLNGIYDHDDSVTMRELLRFEQPLVESFPSIGSNHNGGHLSFDQNNFLLIAIGDGGDANDTGNGHGVIGTGADPSNIWGTIVRIDPAGTNSLNGMYGIPDDNPFVNDDDKLDEIYAYGFRNPWYPSVDPDSGVIYSADSGQDNVQEINVVEKGKFHGWRAREGSYLFDNLIGNNGN